MEPIKLTIDVINELTLAIKISTILGLTLGTSILVIN